MKSRASKLLALIVFYCTVIRLLLLTGSSSMLLIAGILLSLIYLWIKSIHVAPSAEGMRKEWKQIKFSHSFCGIKCNVIDVRRANLNLIRLVRVHHFKLPPFRLLRSLSFSPSCIILNGSFIRDAVF